ncbi:hypothetical protein FW755_05155 [Lonepinella koalarum]|uniref:Uncharacterized protein n=1 Tax=Lonepinella koalarum TaxID=53417 RepID=A0A4R1L275_9PAST|nr:hypothetical protein [Lonepinella koalarum]MDH2925840.1 hypothetical protein [Lonepinella koalarum]TCK70993.1 hypothetical protein EV692_0044 [Lonepinella koalarum]TFJ90727.1 hypothetical protein E0709_00215 [Lonepinella koalarum]TYG34511.1 hypothetical protein FW755_05155 [Lonepinella koalarum]
MSILSNLNLFKVPIEQDTLDAWAKMAEDIAKVAILALPVVVLGQGEASLKVWSSVALLVVIYSFLLGGRLFRQNKSRSSTIQEN